MQKSNDSSQSKGHTVMTGKQNQGLSIESQIKQIKLPFIEKIHELRHHFDEMKNQAKNEGKSETCFLLSNNAKQQEKNAPSNEESSDDQNRQELQNRNSQKEKSNQIKILRQWSSKSSQKCFVKFESMISDYEKIFQKKVKFFSKSQKNDLQSFKIDEKQFFQKLYSELKQEQQDYVIFAKIIQFFDKSRLFYKLYNIHPLSLKGLLKEASRNQFDYLCREEFMNFFLLNNRTMNDYDYYCIDKKDKRFVLAGDKLKELKQIYDSLDTYGHQVVKLNHLLKKIANSRSLMMQKILAFPEIQRFYTFEKIVMQLQNKYPSVGNEKISWESFIQLLKNFRHIENPSIEQIEKKNIQNGRISVSTNSFILKDQVLVEIKNLFKNCPKYCKTFVKIAHFYEQLIESECINNNYGQVVRNQPENVNLRECVNQIRKYCYMFFDLDEIIQIFSIKGSKIFGQKNQKPFSYDDDSQQEKAEEQLQQRLRQKRSNLKNNLSKKSAVLNKKYTLKQNIKIEEFNLSKKNSSTIRDKKVQEMIKEKQQQDDEELEKKFKANPVPSSLSTRRYKKYINKIQKERLEAKEKRQRMRQNDQGIIRHLLSNTKIFEKKKDFEQEQQQYYFEANSIPWFVYAKRMDQIDNKKLQRREKLRKQSKDKYVNQYWKKLPQFMMNQKQSSESQSQTEQNQLDKKQSQKVKPVPDFNYLHKKFEEQLQNAKPHTKITKIQEFNLSVSKKTDKNISHIKKEKYSIEKEKLDKILFEPCSNYIGSTLKYESQIKLKDEKRRQSALKKEKEDATKEKRKMNEKIFSKMVQKELQKQLKEMSRVKQNKVPTKINKLNKHGKQYKKQLEEMYEKIMRKPFLFQSARLRQNPKRVQLIDKPENMISQISQRYIENMGIELDQWATMKEEDKQKMMAFMTESAGND